MRFSLAARAVPQWVASLVALAAGTAAAIQAIAAFQPQAISTPPESRLWTRLLDAEPLSIHDLVGDAPAGTVVLEIQIEKDGSLAWIRTVESPQVALAARLTEAVRRWRFSSSTGVVRGKLTFIVRRDSNEPVLLIPGQLAAREAGRRAVRLRNGWTLPAGAIAVSPTEFETQRRSARGVALDLRPVAEFEAAPSEAMNVPLERLDDFLATSKVADLIFLDCTSGRPPNCALASWTIRRRGAGEVVIGVPADEVPPGPPTSGR